MMQQAEEVETWKPPYVAYTTLVNLLDEKLGTNPIPPRIDRGFLDNHAGSVQAMLLATLKTVGLISEDGRVQESLKAATRNPASRREVLRTWATKFYAEQLKLAEQNATAQMLHESFARHKVTGSTLRKAVVFYLALVEDTGLPNSPHFKPPKQIVSANSARTKKRVPLAGPEPTGSFMERPSGEKLVVDLGAAGRVLVTVDVRWLQLPMEKFSKLRSVLAELEALSAEPPVPAPASTEGE